MGIQEILKRLTAEFGSEVILESNSESLDPWIVVAPAHISKVAAFLKNDPALRFNSLCDLTGVDYFEPDSKLAAKFPFEPHLEVVYHILSIPFRHRLKMKVKLPRWKDGVEGQLPELPTVSDVWAIANWHEREAYDLVGINFIGHPNLVRILCVDDWVGHPLRKDYEFPLEYHGVRGR